MASRIMLELVDDEMLFSEGADHAHRFFLAPELVDTGSFYRIAHADRGYPPAAAEFAAR